MDRIVFTAVGLVFFGFGFAMTFFARRFQRIALTAQDDAPEWSRPIIRVGNTIMPLGSKFFLVVYALGGAVAMAIGVGVIYVALTIMH